jgi:transposase
MLQYILLYPTTTLRFERYDFFGKLVSFTRKEPVMAKPFVSDELWARIEPLLPEHHSPGPNGGRPPVDDRAALTGILFVLRSGIPWELLPQEMHCGCGMTCWRRLRDWQEAGVWEQLLAVLLSELRGADKIDWSRAAADSSSIRAVGGGEATGPNPTDRSRPGTKHHVLVDGHGIPLAVTITGANTPDVQQLLPLVVAIPAVGGKPGHPRSRPESLYADRAYDSEPARSILRWLGIKPFLARRRTGHGSGLGKIRWVVERTISWLHQQRRLRVRYERRKDIHKGFLVLTACLICFNIFLGLS